MKPTVFALSIAFFLSVSFAQNQTVLNLTAKSANVSESGTPVRINILRWSTDEERTALVGALNGIATAASAARGARRGLDPNDPAMADVVAAERGARGGRGGGRGGRGGDAPAAASNPTALLTSAIGSAQTLGYIWTNEVVGYSLKYAYRTALPNGGERIILATDRRLGGYSSSWKPANASTPTDYEFTVVEIRLDPKGLGEGKTSLTSKVVNDNDAKTIALENYAAAPALLQSVKK